VNVIDCDIHVVFDRIIENNKIKKFDGMIKSCDQDMAKQFIGLLN
jgi:hypothetical protein